MEPANLILFAVPLLLIAFMFTSQRKRQRAFLEQQQALAVGQDVVTTSGLHGRIVTIDQSVAVLEIAPGTQVRWERRALTSPAAIASPSDPTPTDPTPTDSTPTEGR